MVTSDNATFEELMVASQEIAAATAQLVVASRVKADRESERMAKLSHSSKQVTEATAQVVATAKSCAQMVDETDTLDFSKLSDVQAKKLEMESKIREKQVMEGLRDDCVIRERVNVFYCCAAGKCAYEGAREVGATSKGALSFVGARGLD